jgi:hypothetical protein
MAQTSDSSETPVQADLTRRGSRTRSQTAVSVEQKPSRPFDAAVKAREFGLNDYVRGLATKADRALREAGTQQIMKWDDERPPVNGDYALAVHAMMGELMRDELKRDAGACPFAQLPLSARLLLAQEVLAQIATNHLPYSTQAAEMEEEANVAADLTFEAPVRELDVPRPTLAKAGERYVSPYDPAVMAQAIASDRYVIMLAYMAHDGLRDAGKLASTHIMRQDDKSMPVEGGYADAVNRMAVALRLDTKEIPEPVAQLFAQQVLGQVVAGRFDTPQASQLAQETSQVAVDVLVPSPDLQPTKALDVGKDRYSGLI